MHGQLNIQSTFKFYRCTLFASVDFNEMTKLSSFNPIYILKAFTEDMFIYHSLYLYNILFLLF